MIFLETFSQGMLLILETFFNFENILLRNEYNAVPKTGISANKFAVIAILVMFRYQIRT